MVDDKKSIGIITWFNQGFNLGQTLQAFALQHYLRKNYSNIFSVEQICYDGSLPSGEIEDYFDLKLELCDDEKKDLCVKFNTFVKDNFCLSPAFSRRYQLYPFLQKKKYDYLISGSDQIWNPNNTDDAYYFNCELSDTKKISYASSIISAWRFDEYKDRFEQLSQIYNSFERISSRERDGKKIIERVINAPIEVVTDPVFLLTADEWSIVASKSEGIIDINEDYILVYLFYWDNVSELLTAVKNKYSINRILVIFTGEESERFSCDCEVIYNVGPEDFIYLFQYATAIVTDSFHGTAFSLIYKKELFSIGWNLEKATDTFAFPERMSDLLDLVQCDRYFENDNQEILDDYIDYNIVENRLNYRIDVSKQYLVDALNIDVLNRIRFKKDSSVKGGVICK